MMVPPAAEALFHVGDFPITNSMVNAWIAVVFFVGVAYLIKRKMEIIPKGFQNVVEGLVEFMLTEIQKVTGDAKKSRIFLPIVGTIFLFVLFSNWLGLLPGTGSIGIWAIHNGHEVLVPILRPAASDLNLTLAIALFAVIASHIFGLKYLGFEDHFNKFLNVRGIIQSIKKGPMAIIIALIEFGVGLIEIISEIAKVLSLSLRLFGNVFAGEVLMTVMLGLFAFILPVPFIFLEMLVGVIQATVFAMLTLAYLTVASSAHTKDAEHESKNSEAHA